MTRVETKRANSFEERLAQLDEDHQRGILRFLERLRQFEDQDLLTTEQAGVVAEHLLRLGERDRNPANTGNIEDLFCYTLVDTSDPIRAYAQAMADSVKVVPMDDDAPLYPRVRSKDGRRWYDRVGDFDHLSPGDKMLVSHTMVAYGDPEMWASAEALVRVSHPGLSEAGVQREVAKMAVQSQHHPSSTFVLARAVGLTLDCEHLYRAAGYSDREVADAQRFYDVCAEFDAAWTAIFVSGDIPRSRAWSEWRSLYLESRTKLPSELRYQLSSDTLTNFHDGTLESGKWTDASVFFGGVTTPEDVPHSMAQIVNQYIVEHVALHDRPARELTHAWGQLLAPWGIGFEDDRAIVLPGEPRKHAMLRAQFEASWTRKNGS